TLISPVLLQAASYVAPTPATTWQPATLNSPANSEWSETLPLLLRPPYIREITNHCTEPPPFRIAEHLFSSPTYRWQDSKSRARTGGVSPSKSAFTSYGRLAWISRFSATVRSRLSLVHSRVVESINTEAIKCASIRPIPRPDKRRASMVSRTSLSCATRT